jgi:hypothetical protein
MQCLASSDPHRDHTVGLLLRLGFGWIMVGWVFSSALGGFRVENARMWGGNKLTPKGGVMSFLMCLQAPTPASNEQNWCHIIAIDLRSTGIQFPDELHVLKVETKACTVRCTDFDHILNIS